MKEMVYKTLPTKEHNTCPTCGKPVHKARNAALYPCWSCRVYWKKPVGNSRFEKGSGCFTCIECGKKTRQTGGNAEVEMCYRCSEGMQWVNYVQDGGSLDEIPTKFRTFVEERI